MDTFCTKLRSIIEKKRDGGKLTTEELHHFIEKVVEKERKVQNGERVEDLSGQIGAMLMAIYFSGLDDGETATLTKLMVNSGKVFKWKDEWRDITVDKHSTGGVGDKISHVLVPVLAACGLKLPMITGRSLDFTGGTLDKLESIPNFNASLAAEEVERALEDIGACIIGQTLESVPADKVLYHYRDITGTVNNVSLITGSVVSKKLSEGLSALVFDVKTGKSAFCETEDAAEELASSMVNVASSNGVKVTAFLTRMEAPIGKMIGNSLEIIETVQCLNGNSLYDIQELVEVFGSELLVLSKRCRNEDEAKILIRRALTDGSALEKFYQILVHQGVDKDVARKCVENPSSVLPNTKHVTEFKYNGSAGVVIGIDGKKLAKLCKKEERRDGYLNYGVGIELTLHLGDSIKEGVTWMKMHHEHPLSDEVYSQVQSSLAVGESFHKSSMILKKISSVGSH
ncbi:thymidine phosphorylase-like [Centruroides vittatus]|uniref:thymidine phosphorylase-like n=1 Tax=Centruroides vittatus TaxID=120091 RepID=UPI00350F8BC6